MGFCCQAVWFRCGLVQFSVSLSLHKAEYVLCKMRDGELLRVNAGTGPKKKKKNSLQQQALITAQCLFLKTNHLDTSSHSFYSYIQKYTHLLMPNIALCFFTHILPTLFFLF